MGESNIAKTHESIKQRQHALEQAKVAMDKAKHALGLAHKAGLVSAADAAKHMMQVTSMVVDKAAAKVAEEEAKKESYTKEIKLVESEVVKKEAELKAARGVQVIETPGAAAADEAQQAQKKAAKIEMEAQQIITEAKKEEGKAV